MKHIAITLAIFVTVLLSVVSFGATLDWDPAVSGAPGNGSGTWDQTVANTNWWDGVGGSNTSWSNAALHDARFAVVDNSGSTYNVTLAENIVANSISLGGGNVTYVIDGAFGLTTGGIQVNNSKKLQLDVPVTLSANQSWSAQGSAAITANQQISGGFSLGRSGAGTLTLNAVNTFTGGFINASGPLRIGNDSALGSGTLSIASGSDIAAVGGGRTIGNAITQAGGGNMTWTFSGSDSLEFTGNFNITNSAIQTKTFNTTNSALTTFSGTISAHANQTIRKTGAETLVFSGNNTYTNQTLVDEGTLIVDGSTVGQGDYLVGNAAIAADVVLGGTGSIGLANAELMNITGSVTNSATVAPGNSVSPIGTLTVGTDATNSVVFGDYSVLEIGVDGLGNADLLVVNGDLDLTSSLDTLNVAGTLGGGAMQIVSYTGNLVGNAQFDTVNGVTGLYRVDYSTPGEIWLAIPEPTSAVLMAMAGLALLRRRR